MSIKTYRAKFNPNSKNVYGVSLVENPAMEGDFIQFSEQNVQFADVDKSKRRIMGLILEPNKKVYRNQNGEAFNIVFTEQDIEDVAYNFQKQANQSTSTIGHSGSNIEGVTFVETWLVENPKVDKSTNFGFSYPKGSWMGVMQIDNEQIWLEYVETGKVKGFSIDAFMQLEEVNLNKVNMSDNKEVKFSDDAIEYLTTKLKSVFAPKKEEIKEEVILEKEVEQVEVKEAETVELQKQVVEVKFNDEELAKFIKEVEAILNPVKDENVALKEQVKEFETKFQAQEERLVELEKQPATKSVNKAIRQVDLKTIPYEEMTNLQKKKYNEKYKK